MARIFTLRGALVAAAFGLLPLPSAFAGDPAPAPAQPSMREVWVLETTVGSSRERKELDVTDMPADLRRETLETLTAIGWRLVEKKAAATEFRAPAPPAAPKQPTPPKARPKPDADDAGASPDVGAIEREIAQLRRELERVRGESARIQRALRSEKERAAEGGGPKDGDDPREDGEEEIEVFGFGPGMRFGGPGGVGEQFAAGRGFAKTFGRLMLKYLDDKKDPAKAAIYEEFFRTAAEAFVAAGEGDGGDGAAMSAALAKVMASLLQAMQDPEKGEVLGGILRILTEGMRAGGGQIPEFGAGKPELGELFRGLERRRIRIGSVDEQSAGLRLGGAALVAAKDAEGFTVTGVGADSVASQIGLEKGDRIVEIGKAPATASSIQRADRAIDGGAGELSLTLVRHGKRIELEIELVAGSDDERSDDERSDDDR